MEKFLNILKYIVALPAAFVGSRLIYIITSFFSHDSNTASNLTGAYGMSNIELYIIDCVVCTAVYVYIIYYIVPNHKKMCMCIGSIIYAIATALIPIISIIIAGFDLWGFIGALLILGTLIVTNLIMFKTLF